MADVMVAGIILIILGFACIYIYKEKKRGVRCIGCPAAGTCGSRKQGECSCGCHAEEKLKAFESI